MFQLVAEDIQFGETDDHKVTGNNNEIFQITTTNFGCWLCAKRFRSRSGLQSHIYKGHKEIASYPIYSAKILICLIHKK